MQEVTFDPVAAIEAAVANKTKAEQQRWRRLQETERSKLRPGNGSSIHAIRAIQLSTEALLDQNDDTDVNFEYTRMAEGYYLLGDFQKAFDLTRDPAKKKEYRELLEATSTACTCPDIRAGKTTISPRSLVKEFPGKGASRCGTCRRLYVTHTG
jgi:hypothetical protein